MTIKRFSFLLLISLIIFPFLAISGNIIYEYFSGEDNISKETKLKNSDYRGQEGCYYGEIKPGSYEIVC